MSATSKAKVVPLTLPTSVSLKSQVEASRTELETARLKWGETGASEEGLDWPRARIVNAAVAAGLLRPPQSVFPNVRDVEGLARSCARGRALGHLGRTAIHPGQLEIIERAYLPTAADVTLARDTIDRLQAEGGASALEGGELVDDAMLGSARLALLLAERYGTAEAPA